MTVLKKAIRGIRQQLPTGYLLGRKSNGAGPVEAIPFADVATQIAKSPALQASVSGQLFSGLAASRPTTLNLAPGQIGFYWATDTLALTLWTGTGWVAVGGGGGGGLWSGLINSSVPNQTGLGFNTWVNQGSATMTDIANVGISFAAPSNGNVSSLRFKWKTAPATPYTIIALTSSNGMNLGNNNGGGIIGWYDGTAKCHALEYYDQASTPVREGKWTNPTTLNSQTLLGAGNTPNGWYRLKDDGTNISADFSFNGVDWLSVIAPIAKASAFNGATGYGKVLLGSDPFGNKAQWTLMSYKETSP